MSISVVAIVSCDQCGKEVAKIDIEDYHVEKITIPEFEEMIIKSSIKTGKIYMVESDCTKEMLCSVACVGRFFKNERRQS